MKPEQLSVKSDGRHPRGVNRMCTRIHFSLKFLLKKYSLQRRICFTFFSLFLGFFQEKRRRDRMENGSNPPRSSFPKRSWPSTTTQVSPSTFGNNHGRRYVFSQPIPTTSASATHPTLNTRDRAHTVVASPTVARQPGTVKHNRYHRAAAV